jgi:hypothetical protein
MNAQVAQVVVYTDKHGCGTQRAAIVKATVSTFNRPQPSENDLAVLAKLGLQAPPKQYDALDESRDEVMLHVFGIDREYTKRAVLNEDGSTYISTPPAPAAELEGGDPESPGFGAFEVQ